MWALETNSCSILFDKDGSLMINGAGTNVYRPATDGSGHPPAALLDAKANWSIQPNSSNNFDFDEHLAEAVKNSPEKMHFSITSFFDLDEPFVGFTVSLPDDLFMEQLSMWKMLLLNSGKMRCALVFDFIAFPVEGADVLNPTLDKWLNSPPYEPVPILGNGVSISFHPVNSI